MSEPVWLSRAALEMLHNESLAEHGGPAGLRDTGLLDSALARPRNLFAYGTSTDLFRLAAAYAFGIAKNHPFVDGNKRAAFIAAGLFLRINGIRLQANRAQAAAAVFDLAAGELSESEFAEWLRRNS
jgi:death-on-curing protein